MLAKFLESSVNISHSRKRRQLYHKCAALPGCTLHIDRAVMRLDDTLRYRQAEAAAPSTARAGAVSAVETLEDVRQVFG